MGFIDDIKSTLTQSALDALCEKFHIPDIVHSVLHGRNNRICNSPTDKIEDLFAFINHADPTKVRICEREVKEGENDDVEDAGNQNDDVQDAGNNVIEEGAADGQEIPFDAGIVRIEDEVPSTVVDNYYSFYYFFRDPTPERESGGRTDSIFGPNLRTQHPAGRSSVPPPLVLTATVAITAIVGAAFAPVHKSSTRPVQRSIFRDSASPSTVGADIVGSSQPAGAENVINDSAFDDPEVCQSMVDHLAPLGFFSQLRGIDYDQLFVKFNVGVAHQACFSAEVKLRSEYSYRERKKFESKCQRQVDLLKEKDTVANLKARLSLNEAEAVEAIRLRNQVAAIEGTEAARVNELNSLKVRTTALEGYLSCDELSIKDASLKSEKDKLTNQVSSLETICSGLRDQVSGYELFKEQIKAVQDKQRWILGRGLRLVVMKCLQSLEYLAALGGAIGRAIDKANYVSAMNSLRVVDFPLLAQLASQKDASIADIMGLFCLDGLAAEVPEANQLQPSLEQLMLPIHRPEDQVVSGETSLSFSLDVVHSRVQRIRGDTATSGVLAVVAATTAFSTIVVQASFVPSIPVSDYEMADTKAQAEASSSPKITFEQEILETSPENPTT
nr:hypothetical protein [Tanacetum cinerariifolium]